MTASLSSTLSNYSTVSQSYISQSYDLNLPLSHLQRAFDRNHPETITSLLQQDGSLSLFESFLKNNLYDDWFGCLNVALLHPDLNKAIELLCVYTQMGEKQSHRVSFTQKHPHSNQTIAAFILTHPTLSQ